MAGRDDTAEIPLSLIGEYPSRWESSTLGRACSLVTDGTHDSPKETQTGFPLVTGRCITGGRINLKAAYFISERDHKEVVARSKPEFGDILFANIGNSIGELARVEINAEFSIKNVALFKPGPQLESRYLKYYLLSAPVQSFIRGNTFGSAQPFVGLGTLRAFPIPLPPLAEQKAIAAVLGALDDKIELNRRMNATLEAMARALFQNWFVDFDPVRAKLDGCQPTGLDATTVALFPSTFQDSALGHIPSGWSAVPLYDTAQYVNGAAFRSEDFCAAGEGLPVIKIGELKDGISAQTKWCQRQAGQNQVIDTGDLLYSWSGSPDTSLEAFLWSGERGLLNQHIFKVIATTKAQKRFVYYLLQYLRPILVETARNKQTTGLGHVTVADMKRLLVCSPTKEVLAAFDRIIAPIFDRAFADTLESRTLATLRDSLLPRLLSGELSVDVGIEATEATA